VLTAKNIDDIWKPVKIPDDFSENSHNNKAAKNPFGEKLKGKATSTLLTHSSTENIPASQLFLKKLITSTAKNIINLFLFINPSGCAIAGLHGTGMIMILPGTFKTNFHDS
jgi:hypothetical protein